MHDEAYAISPCGGEFGHGKRPIAERGVGERDLAIA
jgi:hypothetical protein